MSNFKRKHVGFWILASLFGILLLLAFVTYNSSASESRWLVFAVQNHTTIMLALAIIAVSFGFSWAFLLYRKVEQEQTTSKSIADLVLKFLSPEERSIISHLVEHSGKATQAELSHIQNMGKVKAFRSVKRLQEKEVVTVEPQGKLRVIRLKDDVLSALQKK